jgi:hypothetical protein
MTINDIQYSWIPSVRSDNDHYVASSEAAEGLSAVDIWICPWATSEQRRVCWDAYQWRLIDGLTHFLIHTESIAGISRTRLYQLRKNIVQMSLPASMSKFIDFDGVIACERDADVINAAMPLLEDTPLHSFDDFLRDVRGFYLIAIEKENINLLQKLIAAKQERPSSSYDVPDALFKFLRNYPVVGVCALGYQDDREKSVLALGSEKTFKRFMNI